MIVYLYIISLVVIPFRKIFWSYLINLFFPIHKSFDNFNAVKVLNDILIIANFPA